MIAVFKKPRKHNLISLGILFLVGCTTLPEQFAREAEVLQMNREVVTGVGFQHVLYRKSGILSKTLHIYLDGDGTPWIAGRPSNDPTPGNPMVLKLMKQDKAPSVYLGRPCYHGAKKTGIGKCSSRYWLNDRYSEAVVVSLLNVVKQLLEEGGYKKVAWFGHSGGGALATLLASRVPQTIAIVTISANLDLDVWTTYTQQNYLTGSLNPAALPAFAQSICQRHYAGSEDRIVPPTLMSKAVEDLGTKLIVIDTFNHICCWHQVWPIILDELTTCTK